MSAEQDTLELQSGERRSIELPNLSMSGYTWEVQVSGTAVSATVEVAPATHDPDQPAVTGPSGAAFAQIVGISPGDATVVLRNKRTWETKVRDERRIAVHVI